MLFMNHMVQVKDNWIILMLLQRELAGQLRISVYQEAPYGPVSAKVTLSRLHACKLVNDVCKEVTSQMGRG